MINYWTIGVLTLSILSILYLWVILLPRYLTYRWYKKNVIGLMDYTVLEKKKAMWVSTFHNENTYLVNHAIYTECIALELILEEDNKLTIVRYAILDGTMMTQIAIPFLPIVCQVNMFNNGLIKRLLFLVRPFRTQSKVNNYYTYTLHRALRGQTYHENYLLSQYLRSISNDNDQASPTRKRTH